MEIDNFLKRLEEGTGPTPNLYYQKIVDAMRKEIIESIGEMIEDDPGDDEYSKELAAAKKAKTISQLSNIARDMAWDYESFIELLLRSLGGAENSNSALFDPRSWDT